MVSVNDYTAFSDNEAIETAIKNKGNDGIVLIPPRKSDIKPERDYWLLDRAILLPENTTVIMQNSRIKLSDKCRDNFFRTDNCGMGIKNPEKTRNIHIKGEGLCVLEGADHPRSTGDSSKILANPCPYTLEDLAKYGYWIPDDRKTKDKIGCWENVHTHSYGTDYGKEGESQKGDWRNIGILFCNTDYFSIENIKIVESHCWGISLEECRYGKITGIDFDARMSKMIDGMLHNIENQDGIDIRNGCNNIIISDVTGRTGDDVVALTAIANPDKQRDGGVLEGSTHVMHTFWDKRDRDIHDVVIKNVVATSDLCLLVRILPANTRIYNIVIDGIIDTCEESKHYGTVMLGDGGNYGENIPDSCRDITISNVISNGHRFGVSASGYLADSVICNVVNKCEAAVAINVDKDDGIKNVKFSNIVSAGKLCNKDYIK